MMETLGSTAATTVAEAGIGDWIDRGREGIDTQFIESCVGLVLPTTSIVCYMIFTCLQECKSGEPYYIHRLERKAAPFIPLQQSYD